MRSINKSTYLLIDEELKPAIITLKLDRWSNISADPFFFVSIHTNKGTYLFHAVDCCLKKESAEYY